MTTPAKPARTVYQDHGIRLDCGDCAEVLYHTTDLVDCVITDAPYHLRTYLIKQEYGMELFDLSREAEWSAELIRWYVAWQTMVQKLAGHEPCWFFVGYTHLGVCLRALTYGRWIVQEFWTVPGAEALIYCGARPLSDEAYLSVFRALRAHGNPNVKPVPLIQAIIDASQLQPNALILDPFCGDGSTLLAARSRGHRAWGIEYRETRCAEVIKALEVAA